METNEIVISDCIEFLEGLEAESIDSCVSDPPYGLDFMGKEWDSFKNHKLMQDFHFKWATALFRVLKPGSHILVFSGTRTYHRLACAFEDSGFEVRDMLAWIYGSGFPKGQNLSKIIDKRLGFSGVPVPKEELPKRNQRNLHTDFKGSRFHRADGEHEHLEHISKLPESDLAKEWFGWNTALKPAHETILLARKALAEKTIVDNVLAHGTGAINIDVCRVAVNPDQDDMHRTVKRKERESRTWRDGSGFKNEHNEFTGVLPSGRYPANLILSHHPDCKLVQEGKTEAWARERDRFLKTGEMPFGKSGIYGKGKRPLIEVEYKVTVPEIWNCVGDCPIRIMNEQSGSRVAGGSHTGKESSQKFGIRGIYGEQPNRTPFNGYGDSGGSSRFFYCAKVQKGERNAGLGYYLKGELTITIDETEHILDDIKQKDILFEESNNEMMNFNFESFPQLDIRFVKEQVLNPHITVKPIELMRYLVRMITPARGTVIDPFVGSGTTAIAAMLEGINFLACDISPEYVDVARKRLTYWKNPPKEIPKRKISLATPGQTILESFFGDN